MLTEGFFSVLLEPSSGAAAGGFFTEGPYFLKFVLLLIIGFIVFTLVRPLRLWQSNNASPLQSRMATAVTKRTEVWGGRGHAGTHTSNFITFEFQDGSRMELEVKAKAYGMIVEGDRGQLAYQGTRFKGFERSGMRGI